MIDRNQLHAAVKFCCVTGCALLGAVYSLQARAELVPPRGVVDSRIRAASYDSDQVYRLRGFIGYQIDLEFEPGETFVGLGAGDMDALGFFGQENHLFIKPRAAKVATNLTVLTSRRRYQIEYTALAQRPDPDDQDVIFALRFIYPPSGSQMLIATEAKRIDSALGGASARRAQNIDYWYCGSRTLRPVAATDDGVHTRLRFTPNADLPAIFVRNADGSESLLNFSMDGGDVIVHRVARQYILRRGKLTGCIVNQGFSGGGRRLESGTVSPEVERKVPGVVP